jgi:hypothetical protein
MHPDHVSATARDGVSDVRIRVIRKIVTRRMRCGSRPPSPIWCAARATIARILRADDARRSFGAVLFGRHAHVLRELRANDCNRGNCLGDYRRQLIVGEDVGPQCRRGTRHILGAIVEGNLIGGSQPLEPPTRPPMPGLSISVPYLGLEDTATLLNVLAQRDACDAAQIEVADRAAWTNVTILSRWTGLVRPSPEPAISANPQEKHGVLCSRGSPRICHPRSAFVRTRALLDRTVAMAVCQSGHHVRCWVASDELL